MICDRKQCKFSPSDQQIGSSTHCPPFTITSGCRLWLSWSNSNPAQQEITFLAAKSVFKLISQTYWEIKRKLNASITLLLFSEMSNHKTDSISIMFFTIQVSAFHFNGGFYSEEASSRHRQYANCQGVLTVWMKLWMYNNYQTVNFSATLPLCSNLPPNLTCSSDRATTIYLAFRGMHCCSFSYCSMSYVASTIGE